MKKIKIFSSNIRDELEWKVNDFMSNHEVIDVQFSASSNINLYAVLVVYME